MRLECSHLNNEVFSYASLAKVLELFCKRKFARSVHNSARSYHNYCTYLSVKIIAGLHVTS